MKALTWYTQIEGYRTSITVIDKDSSARDRFHHACPGYFDGSADSHCTIEIFSKMHTASPEFDRLIKEHKDIGYVFVALGNDSLNVNVAYDLRSRFAYMDKHPVIQTVVRNKQVSDALSAGQTYNGQRYDVEFIGSFEELYSYKMILDLEAKERIFKENLKWVDENRARSLISDSEEAFRRSRANDIFTKLLLKLCIPKGEIAERSRHRSWVNLMFSEGYRHGKYRDQIAKTHAGLVDYEDLPPPFAPKE